MNRLRKQLGAQVRRLRLARRLTQSQLAEAVGRSTDLLSRIERGQAAPLVRNPREPVRRAPRGPVGALRRTGGHDRSGKLLPADVARLLGELSPEEQAWAADLLRLARARPRRM